MEIYLLFKDIPIKKSLVTNVSLVNSNKHLGQIEPILYNIVQKKYEAKESSSNFMRPELSLNQKLL